MHAHPPFIGSRLLGARVVAAALCCAAFALAPRAARADGFQDHLNRAGSLAAAERYREALVELDAAYAVRQSPRILYLKAKAQQQLGDAKAAIAGYRAFLAAGSEADAAVQADAQQQLAKLTSLGGSPPPASPQPVSPPPRPLPADGGVFFSAKDEESLYRLSTDGAQCDTPCRLELAPGQHRVTVTGAGSFDFDLTVPRTPGVVRVQHPWNGVLVSGIVVTTLGSVMMIGGNIGALRSLAEDGEGGGSGFVPAISFGWFIGPITHLVGIGLIAAGASKLRDANTFRPVALDLAPTAHGTTGRVTFAF